MHTANFFEEGPRERLFKTISDYSRVVKQSSSHIEGVAVKSNFKCYVFACGGDGSTEWVISSLEKYNADFLNIIITLVPIGTGCDFNNSLNLSGRNPKFEIV